MADGDENNETKEAKPAAETRGFTQADMDALAGRTKAETKRAAIAGVAEDLGCTIEEAKAIIAKGKQAEDAEATDAQRATKAAEKAKAEADTAKAEAAQERHDARIERALVAAGITDETKLARLARLVDSAVGDDIDKIKADVKVLAKDMPELFGKGAVEGAESAENGAEGEAKKPVSGDPAGKPPKPAGGQDAFARGAERAKAANADAGYAILGSAGQGAD